ncbi:LacI family DNA-binding transcriptional regulator [Calidithermus terrae]|nr:LacI family DNA-binding transcriptional regulator [Calidithermus terrae]
MTSAKRKPTIHEVAHMAGVGIGTVSRVINNHPSVRAETRARVQQAMEHLGYAPNPHARRVAGGRSYTVSVLLPFVATEFYTRLIEGLEATLSEERYDLALFPLITPKRLERYLRSNTLAYQTDGLIVASYDLTEHFVGGQFPTDRPVVLVDARNPNYDSVFMDNFLGGKLAAEYLARFPGELFFITVEEDIDRIFSHTVFAERRAGFQQGAALAGRTVNPDQIFNTRLSAEGGRLALQSFLRHYKLPFNIFAGADLIALGVLEEVERLGLKLGHDVRLLGFDGQPWTAQHGLSTLAQPVEAMGARAAGLLLERLQNRRAEARQVRFEPHLIERASTLGAQVIESR